MKQDLILKLHVAHQGEDKIKDNTKSNSDKIISLYIYVKMYINIHAEEAGV